MNVRLFRPTVGEEELQNIREVFDRSWLGLGPTVTQFEKAWSQYIGAPTSVAVNSGTAALHLALARYGFPEGKKVLVPSLTFVASATCILYNRLKPVFVDVDPETLQVDPDDLERKADADCVAMVVVHFGGHPAPMERILEVARQKNLKVIEDCAHSAGGEYPTGALAGRKLGMLSDIGCYSFEEKKGMTCGDGGMLSSPDPELIEPLRAHRWIGIDKDTWKREKGLAQEAAESRHWHYEVSVLGYKYNMNDVAAAIGMAQLEKLDGFNARKNEILTRYLDGLAHIPRVAPLLPYHLSGSSYHMFGVRLPQGERDAWILHLKGLGIATGVHYMPIHLHPLLQREWEGADPTPVATGLWESFLTLPMHTALTDAEVDHVLHGLSSFPG
ncbi:MAG: DegT/DnrJ/EryC1/StrS aminotransferase family protein [Gemmatimonadota bacterium]